MDYIYCLIAKWYYTTATLNHVIIDSERRTQIQERVYRKRYTKKMDSSPESGAIVHELKEQMFLSIDERDHPILKALMEGCVPKEVTRRLQDQGQEITLAAVTKRIQRIRNKLGHLMPQEIEIGSTR